MDKFYLILGIIIIFTPSYYSNKIDEENSLTKHRYDVMSQIRIFLVFIALLVVSGFRRDFIDTNTYRLMFNNVGTSFEYALNQTDKGFFLLMALLNYISSNSQIMVFVSSLIILVLVIKTLIRYSSDLKLSIYLFVASGFYAVSMNGIRQYIAVAISFAALPLLIKERKGLLIVTILLASMFHSSAVIFFLVFFFAHVRVFSKRYFIILASVVLFLSSSSVLAPWLFTFLEGSHYTVYLNDVISGSVGAGFIRMIVEAAPVLLAFILYILSDKTIFYTNKLLAISVNLSMLNLLFYILSLQTWIFARVGLYFQTFNLILIPLLINLFFNNKDKLFVKSIIYILYTIYFIYQMKYGYGVVDFLLNFKIF